MLKIFEIGYEKHSNDIFKTSDKVQLSTSFEKTLHSKFGNFAHRI